MYKGVLIGHPLMSQCNKFVSRHKPLTHRQWLNRMEQVSEIDLDADFYGNGPVVTKLEETMADLLGKEKALFVHKGMVGQHAVLLENAKQTGRKSIAIHPQSHMEVDESLAYKKLLNLDAVYFGKENQAIQIEDIDTLPLDLSTICVELPTRRTGFKLPEWHTLEHLRAFTNQHEIPLHLDGARLFESAHYWQKSYAQVAALSDSVYVSLYKTLGAAAGGIIAGDKAYIDQLLPWQTRLGGNIFTVFPYVLSALWGLENYLPHIAEYNLRAHRLAYLIRQSLGDSAIPNPVQCSAFLVALPINSQILEKRALEIAEKQKIWLFDRIYADGENSSLFEIQVGDALDDWEDTEFVELLTTLIA